MSESLPERIEKTIRLHEKLLTEELRELTGRDDLTVTFDREQLVPEIPDMKDWPAEYWESQA